ncbi:MAG: signal peptidase I [Spirochaetaceae bacterium]|jgi:signal peptidase I|nr:signal peptidase I [Spirochaetaceae bacterium]
MGLRVKIKVGRTILAAFAAALIVKLFFFDFVIVSGESMQPAIKDGKVLVVNRLSYGFKPFAHYIVRWASPKEGDVVVFVTPFGDVAVKRCSNVATQEGYFSALGDNGSESFDSRFYGQVPVDSIIGKAVGIK